MNYCEHQDVWDSASSETQREKKKITPEANNLVQWGWDVVVAQAHGQYGFSVEKHPKGGSDLRHIRAFLTQE